MYISKNNQLTSLPAHQLTIYGFTMVELLITASIFAAMSVAIFASFAGGFRVFERAKSSAGERADVLISLDKIERDLRNTVNSSKIDFIGERESVSFAGLTSEGALGRVAYYVKGNKGMLTREEQEYPRATLLKFRKGKGRAQKLVSVKDIDFSYYYYNPETEEYKWKDFWEAPGNEDAEEKPNRVPLGVRIEVTFKEASRSVTLNRAVLIPVGQSGAFLKSDG